MQSFRTGEFARKAGVTLRTLRYYDRIGLLKPAARSAAGQRLYTELDYVRLQQILTLKFIGLPLSQIRDLLTSDPARIPAVLDQQKRVLQTRADQLNTIIAAISHARQTLRTTFDLEQFVSIIQAINRSEIMDWQTLFSTETEHRQLAEVGQRLTLHEQRDLSETWRTLITEILPHLRDTVTPAQVADWRRRWDSLLLAFAGQDVSLAAALHRAYLRLDAGVSDQAWAAQAQQVAQFLDAHKG